MPKTQPEAYEMRTVSNPAKPFARNNPKNPFISRKTPQKYPTDDFDDVYLELSDPKPITQPKTFAKPPVIALVAGAICFIFIVVAVAVAASGWIPYKHENPAVWENITSYTARDVVVGNATNVTDVEDKGGKCCRGGGGGLLGGAEKVGGCANGSGALLMMTVVLGRLFSDLW
jgi:hypothetical protein